MSWLGKTAKLSFILLFFSFLLDLLYKGECEKVSYDQGHKSQVIPKKVTSHKVVTW